MKFKLLLTIAVLSGCGAKAFEFDSWIPRPSFTKKSLPHKPMVPPSGDDQEALKKEVIDYAAQDHGASLADPVIAQIINEAVEKSGIEEHVIPLQRNNGDNSYAGKLINNPYCFIALGVRGKTLEQIESDCYHECGHIALGHFSENAIRERFLLTKSGQITSFALAAGAFTKIFKECGRHYVVKYALGTIGGFATLCATIMPFVAYKNYQKHKAELDADKFMYEQLIKQKKIGAVCGQISDYLWTHEFSQKDLPWFATGYPSSIERARLGIQMLHNNGYSVDDLIENMPEDTDPGIQRIFGDQIKKHFPEYVHKKVSITN